MWVAFLKIVDKYIGYLACMMIRSQQVQRIDVMTSVLIIRPGGIGDAVLLIPVIQAIKIRFPHSVITVLAERRNAGVFILSPQVDKLLLYDKLSDLITTMCGRYDVVIDTEQWHRLSALFARFVNAPVKIGFNTNERQRMFTHHIKYSHDDYEVDSFKHLLEPLGMSGKDEEFVSTFLAIPVSVSEKVVHLLAAFHDNPFVVIFPGASIAQRRWGAERFAEVARYLIANGYEVIVVGGQEERCAGNVIIEAGGENLAGMTNLAETAAVMLRSNLVISGDTGVLHIAIGLGVPTVSLFGPGIATKWAPRGDKHIVLNRKLFCSPCTRFGTTPPCPHNVRCMKEITAAQVVEGAVTPLKRTAKS